MIMVLEVKVDGMEELKLILVRNKKNLFLLKNKLEIINISEDLDFTPVSSKAKRWFITARKSTNIQEG